MELLVLKLMIKHFNPLNHPICFSFPVWLTESAWLEHVAFAMFLVSVAKPKVLVELGTWRGVSYCAFCQAVKESRTETRCYAIDTWCGDEHAGTIGEEALLTLREHHDPNYGSFSSLIKSTFGEALRYFSDASVDLLHIDGFHTYDAAKRDFESWLPKMSERGIVLFHDLNVREREFGVYRVWEELQAKYPSFAFVHGHGLGVLAVGAEIPDDLRFLFEADETTTTLLRKFFYALGSRIAQEWRAQERERVIFAQKKQIALLQSYGITIMRSNLLRAYRTFKNQGVGGLLKKVAKQK